MKLSLIYSALIPAFLLMVSCTQDQHTKQLEADTELSPPEQASAQPVEQENSKQNQEQLAKECEAYFAEWKKLNAGKAAYFEHNILSNALANPELPEHNREFLLALKPYLHQSLEERSKILAPDQLLFPIFKLNEGELGIFGFPEYDMANQTLSDISAESSLLNSRYDSTVADLHTEPTLIFHQEITDSLFRNSAKPVYTFTTKKHVETQVQNFGSYTGECLEYYHYQLGAKPYNSSDRVLFGSKYNLNLDYRNFPEIDLLMRNQVKPHCADCPSSEEFTKTFAAVKGVDGLYFVYADTFPLNNKLSTPSRGLVMKMGDKMVFLWYKEVDLFGCSCL